MRNKILKPLAIASLLAVVPLTISNAYAVGTNARPSAFKLLSICGTAGNLPCKVGEVGPGGGTIFYVDNTNQYPWGYLEVAPTDAGKSDWCDITSTRISATTATGKLGDGKADTLTMTDACKNGAANNLYNTLILDMAPNSSPKWYLPSVSELQLIQANIAAKLGWKKVAKVYWTSTEYSATDAYLVDGLTGIASPALKSDLIAIRPIRSFGQ